MELDGSDMILSSISAESNSFRQVNPESNIVNYESPSEYLHNVGKIQIVSVIEGNLN